MKVRAEQLRKGDYLPGMKTTVVQVVKGGRIPSDKVEVVLKTGKGMLGLRTALWNRTTEVTVERRSHER